MQLSSSSSSSTTHASNHHHYHHYQCFTNAVIIVIIIIIITVTIVIIIVIIIIILFMSDESIYMHLKMRSNIWTSLWDLHMFHLPELLPQTKEEEAVERRIYVMSHWTIFLREQIYCTSPMSIVSESYKAK